jgi:hypothetical protein
LVIEPLILTMRKLWNRSQWRHTPTRPPSAGYYQAFNVPIRRSAVALLWTVDPAPPGEIYSTEGAAKARGWRRPQPANSCGWTGILARFCGSAGPSGLGDQSCGSRRQQSSTTGCRFRNLRVGSSVDHLLIASQAAEPKMPTNCTADDFLVVRLHPLRARTISGLVTTLERVGRTIKPKLRSLMLRSAAQST